MTPYYTDDWLTIYQGDVRDVLPSLPSDSVDCIVTSPPYWGLRDYGTASWNGGEVECDHKGKPIPTSAGFNVCGKCGATRSDGQLGLERTPEEYVANMVGVFRELRRVLKPSGTCWLNLGDSYSLNQRAGAPKTGSYAPERPGWPDTLHQRTIPPGLKPKDLVGIPWRVAFALQADGWYLRSDIIWAKPNPMPESVTDRPTKSHEYLFLLTKSARYYFDADAVREADSGQDHRRAQLDGQPSLAPPGQSPHRGIRTVEGRNGTGRNLRSVWTIATRPYPGAHFAVFPPELPERCIKAGSSERGVCPDCGAPWERVVERTSADVTQKFYSGAGQHGSDGRRLLPERPGGFVGASSETTGWRPACRHGVMFNRGEIDAEWVEHDPVPAVVLDPFAGSGTTGMVANRLSRRAILIDLNGDYLKQQLKRNAQTPLGLAG